MPSDFYLIYLVLCENGSMYTKTQLKETIFKCTFNSLNCMRSMEREFNLFPLSTFVVRRRRISHFFLEIFSTKKNKNRHISE